MNHDARMNYDAAPRSSRSSYLTSSGPNRVRLPVSPRGDGAQ
jgi:hypothetical protein